MRTRVKICCIATPEEAELAIRYGADALGLVAEMPSGPGPIPDDRIREIAARIPPPIDSFLLTSRTAPDAVVAHVRDCGPTVVQLVDRVGVDVYAALRRETPQVRIVQVVHVEDDGALAEARRAAEHVDAILLDSGRPSSDTPQLGGTGRTHDWSVSRRIVRELTRPVFLAGGLNADNVAGAIRAVRPHGVDVCSGVRRGGRLDEQALGAFITALGGAERFAEFRERPGSEARPDPPGDLELRPARLDDIDALGRVSADREGGSAQAHAEALRGALERDPERRKSLVLVATLDGEVVGFGKARFFAGKGGGDESPNGWYLSGVVVDPSVRRRGIGARLTAERLAWIALRSEAAYYFANACNRVSIALHTAFGFAEIARGPAFCGVTFTGGEGILFTVKLPAAPLDPHRLVR